MVCCNESAFVGQRIVGLSAQMGVPEDVAKSIATANKEERQTKKRENFWKKATKVCASKITRDIHRHCHPEDRKPDEEKAHEGAHDIYVLKGQISIWPPLP